LDNIFDEKPEKKGRKNEKNLHNPKKCCTFASSVPAKPLYNAQIGGAFF
jgi:hypothetical protein